MSLNKENQASHARAQKAYAAARPTNLTPAVTYGNANTDGPYMGNNMGTSRAGANHKHASLPMGAQIVRCVCIA